MILVSHLIPDEILNLYVQAYWRLLQVWCSPACFEGHSNLSKAFLAWLRQRLLSLESHYNLSKAKSSIEVKLNLESKH